MTEKMKMLIDNSNYMFNNLEIKEDFKFRNLYKHVINTKDNLVLLGMRQIGKTEFLKHIIKNSKLKQSEILFISLDTLDISGINIDKTLRSELGVYLLELLKNGEIKIVLIDEIQRLDDWGSFLKALIDMFAKVRFYATGSDAILLHKGSEFGVGRFVPIYVGAYTYYEYKQVHPTGTLIDYIDNYSFATGNVVSVRERFQQVVERQILESNISREKIESVFKEIAHQPGKKHSYYAMVKLLSEITKLNIAQVKQIIRFLVDSTLLIKVPNRKQTKEESLSFLLYPTNWNIYKHYRRNKSYEELLSNSSIAGGLNKLPTKGFVFENMIISNVSSFLETSYDRSLLSTKIEEPDVDFFVEDQAYEVKSIDVLDSPNKDKYIQKAKVTKSIIIHTGKTTSEKTVKFINVEKFLLELPKLINSFN